MVAMKFFNSCVEKNIPHPNHVIIQFLSNIIFLTSTYTMQMEKSWDSHANRQPLKGNTLGHKSLVNQSKSVFLLSPFFAHMYIFLLLKSSKIPVTMCLLWLQPYSIFIYHQTKNINVNIEQVKLTSAIPFCSFARWHTFVLEKRAAYS